MNVKKILAVVTTGLASVTPAFAYTQRHQTSDISKVVIDNAVEAGNQNYDYIPVWVFVLIFFAIAGIIGTLYGKNKR